MIIYFSISLRFGVVRGRLGVGLRVVVVFVVGVGGVDHLRLGERLLLLCLRLLVVLDLLTLLLVLESIGRVAALRRGGGGRLLLLVTGGSTRLRPHLRR